MFAFLSIFRRSIFPSVQCVRKTKLLKKCYRLILDSLNRSCGTFRLFVYTFLNAAFFVALLVVIQKVLPLNHKDVGMRDNEDPNVWSSNLMYYQPIYLQNNCVFRDPWNIHLNQYASYHRHLVETAESAIVLAVSVVNETYVDWFSTGVRPHRLKHTQCNYSHKYLYHIHAPISTAHSTC